MKGIAKSLKGIVKARVDHLPHALSVFHMNSRVFLWFSLPSCHVFYVERCYCFMFSSMLWLSVVASGLYFGLADLQCLALLIVLAILYSY